MNNFQHFHLCTCQGLSFLSAIFNQKHWFLQSLLPRKTLDFQHFVYICQLFICLFISCLFTFFSCLFTISNFQAKHWKIMTFFAKMATLNSCFIYFFVYMFSCLFTIFSCLFTFFSPDNVNKNVNKQLKITSLNSTFWQKSRETSMFLLQIQKVNKQLIVYIFKNLNFRAKT